ncbi:hypothetical protein QFZ27_002363 [Inquilinus ginsengisoli]|jgi:hypothetical protein|uniref:hypothetical protein n=1 Tax=Inquilinus ginsengisoli TaxID=363840 RepID=UPI003D1B1434
MSLSFLRRFAAGAMLGAAGSFAAVCGALGEQVRYAPAPVARLGIRSKVTPYGDTPLPETPGSGVPPSRPLR